MTKEQYRLFYEIKISQMRIVAPTETKEEILNRILKVTREDSVRLCDSQDLAAELERHVKIRFNEAWEGMFPDPRN